MSPREKRTVRIIGERNIYLHLGNPAHHESITKIGKALSSPLRLKILDMLRNIRALPAGNRFDSGHPPVLRRAPCKDTGGGHLIVTETQRVRRLHAGLYLQHPVLSLRNLRFLHRLRQ